MDIFHHLLFSEAASVEYSTYAIITLCHTECNYAVMKLITGDFAA